MQTRDILVLKELMDRVLARERLYTRLTRELTQLLRPAGVRLSFMVRRRFWLRLKAVQWLEMVADQERASTFYQDLLVTPVSADLAEQALTLMAQVLENEFGDDLTFEERRAISNLASFVGHALKARDEVLSCGV